MTKAKISQYDAVAGNNTDVNGVNIAEGCPPSSMNNMGREIMAALKRYQVGSDGDGVTVGGNLVVSGSTTANTFNVDVISEKTSAAGVTVDGVILKDSQVSTDQINEKTSATGVTVDGVLLKDNGASLGGNLAFTGTGNRITGDFSNATIASRVFLQSSTTNGQSALGLLPNGTSTQTAYLAFNSTDPANSSFIQTLISATEGRINSGQLGTGTNLPMTFYTGGSERMRIDSSGNVLVGTTTTTQHIRLDQKFAVVTVGSNDFGGISNSSYNGTSAGVAPLFDFQRSRGTAEGSMTAVASGDTLGYLVWRGADGTNFVDSAFIRAEVDGTVATAQVPARITFNVANSAGSMTERARIDSAGTITFNAYGAGTLSTSASGVISASDGRYKTKTREVTSGLEAIAALQPTYFRWNEESPFASEYEELGFVAQEVAAVIPEASPGEDEEGKYRNYHDRAIIAMLVKGMQEQQTLITALTARVAALESN